MSDTCLHFHEGECRVASRIAGVPVRFDTTACQVCHVNLRLKRYQSLALQTVPVGESEPGRAQVVLFDLSFFGRRPGWRFGTV